jgi:hypothetical protein
VPPPRGGTAGRRDASRGGPGRTLPTTSLEEPGRWTWNARVTAPRDSSATGISTWGERSPSQLIIMIRAATTTACGANSLRPTTGVQDTRATGIGDGGRWGGGQRGGLRAASLALEECSTPQKKSVALHPRPHPQRKGVSNLLRGGRKGVYSRDTDRGRSRGGGVGGLWHSPLRSPRRGSDGPSRTAPRAAARPALRARPRTRTLRPTRGAASS